MTPLERRKKLKRCLYLSKRFDEAISLFSGKSEFNEVTILLAEILKEELIWKTHPDSIGHIDTAYTNFFNNIIMGLTTFMYSEEGKDA